MALTPNNVVIASQGELTGREVSLHNQKLALESVIKELQDAKQTIDRFRCELVVVWGSLQAIVDACSTIFSSRVYIMGFGGSSVERTLSHVLSYLQSRV